jgi:hypothetical protein
VSTAELSGKRKNTILAVLLHSRRRHVKNTSGFLMWTGALGIMNVVVHFGGRLSRQLDASFSLSQAARTRVQRRRRNPAICANLARNPPARRNAQQGLPHRASLRLDPM